MINLPLCVHQIWRTKSDLTCPTSPHICCVSCSARLGSSASDLFTPVLNCVTDAKHWPRVSSDVVWLPEWIICVEYSSKQQERERDDLACCGWVLICMEPINNININNKKTSNQWKSPTVPKYEIRCYAYYITHNTVKSIFKKHQRKPGNNE